MFKGLIFVFNSCELHSLTFLKWILLQKTRMILISIFTGQCLPILILLNPNISDKNK